MIETGLRDKVVIVTGAAAGIGKATARRFAQEGCRVASWDVKDAEAEEGGAFQKVDVTSAPSVEGALAGVMSDDQFDSVIGVNLKGVFTCARAVVPRMIQGGGVILNASSVVGLYGNFGQTNYIAAKAGATFNIGGPICASVCMVLRPYSA